MKKYIKLAAIIALSVMTSCSDFLDLPSKTTMSSDIFYQTESDFQQAINGAYSLLRDQYSGSDGAWAMGELRSDNTTYVYNPNDRGTIQAEFINNFLET